MIRRMCSIVTSLEYRKKAQALRKWVDVAHADTIKEQEVIHQTTRLYGFVQRIRMQDLARAFLKWSRVSAEEVIKEQEQYQSITRLLSIARRMQMQDLGRSLSKWRSVSLCAAKQDEINRVRRESSVALNALTASAKEDMAKALEISRQEQMALLAKLDAQGAGAQEAQENLSAALEAAHV